MLENDNLCLLNTVNRYRCTDAAVGCLDVKHGAHCGGYIGHMGQT